MFSDLRIRLEGRVEQVEATTIAREAALRTVRRHPWTRETFALTQSLTDDRLAAAVRALEESDVRSPELEALLGRFRLATAALTDAFAAQLGAVQTPDPAGELEAQLAELATHHPIAFDDRVGAAKKTLQACAFACTAGLLLFPVHPAFLAVSFLTAVALTRMLILSKRALVTQRCLVVGKGVVRLSEVARVDVLPPPPGRLAGFRLLVVLKAGPSWTFHFSGTSAPLVKGLRLVGIVPEPCDDVFSHLSGFERSPAVDELSRTVSAWESTAAGYQAFPWSPDIVDRLTELASAKTYALVTRLEAAPGRSSERDSLLRRLRKAEGAILRRATRQLAELGVRVPNNGLAHALKALGKHCPIRYRGSLSGAPLELPCFGAIAAIGAIALAFIRPATAAIPAAVALAFFLICRFARRPVLLTQRTLKVGARLFALDDLLEVRAICAAVSSGGDTSELAIRLRDGRSIRSRSSSDPSALIAALAQAGIQTDLERVLTLPF